MPYQSHEIDKIEYHVTEEDGSKLLVLRRQDGSLVEFREGAPFGTFVGIPTGYSGVSQKIATPSFITLPNNWFSGAWFTGKAAAGSAPTWAAFLGDSITEGFNVANTGWLATSWTEKLIASLLAAGPYARYADFYPWWSYAFGGGGSDPVNEGFDSPPGCSVAEGPLGPSWYLTTAGDESIGLQTCTSSSVPGLTTATFTAFDLVYYDDAAGTWGFTIDGGQGGSPTVSGATWNAGLGIWQVTNANAQKMLKVQVTGLANTSHVIQWGWVSTTAGVPMMHGISIYQNTVGLGFVRQGFNSRALVDLASLASGHSGFAGGEPSFPQDKIGLWAGVSPTSGTASLSPSPFGFPVQPSLAVISYGVNDCAAGINVNMFQFALTQLVRAFRRGTRNCNVMIVANANPDGWYSDAPTGGNRGGLRYPRFKAAMTEVARASNCAYVDVDGLFGEDASGQGYVTSADIHPTAAGYTLMANTLAGVL